MRHVKHWQFAFFVALSTSVALAEDFKTVTGKEYNDATVTRVEGDGIIVKTKTGISKIYFVELPKDVQERFHPAPATPTVTPIQQQTPEQAHRSGKVVVVGQGAGSLKFYIAGILLLVVVVLAIVRRR